MSQTDYEVDAADVDWKATAEEMQREVTRLRGELDAAHGLICNAHLKRVDDVTNEDGASPGWAEAARRWIDAYPFGAPVAEAANPWPAWEDMTEAQKDAYVLQAPDVRAAAAEVSSARRADALERRERAAQGDD